MLSLAAFAAGLGWMAPVQAGNVVCKASVQDVHPGYLVLHAYEAWPN